MAFDFPASPSAGQLYNGYTWNGAAWVGGFQAQSGSNAEQFFNLAGLASLDITVPTWARGAVIDGSVFAGTAANYAGLQVSIDGTTFYAGTSYQLVGGPFHNQTGGYANQAAGGSPSLYLSYPKSNLLIPHVFQCQLSLESNSTTQLITARSEAQGYDNTALGFQMWWQGYLNINLTPPARVQKLRIIAGSGAFANGYVKIKWIGDLAQVPVGASIVDAPADGAEYVRINNVWRKKSQSFVLDGLALFDISVPPGAKVMRALGTVERSVGGASSLCARASWDGTNFPATASDYHMYVGWIQYSGGASPGMVSLISTVGNAAYLTFNNDATTVTDMFDWRINIVRPNSAVAWSGLVNSMSYQTAAANLYNNTQHRNAVMHTNAGSVLDLKKFRFFPTVGSFGTPSTLAVDWIY